MNVCKNKEVYEARLAKNRRQKQGEFRTASTVACNLIAKARLRVRDNGRNGVVTVDKQWVLERIQRGVSELSGTPFVIAANAENNYPHAQTPSIDRIDPSNPNYSPDNCRLVCFQENMALGPYGAEASLPILDRLVRALKARTS